MSQHDDPKAMGGVLSGQLLKSKRKTGSKVGFGELLRTFRLSKRIKVIDVARIARMNAGNLSRLEGGHYPPPNSRAKVERICASIPLTPTELRRLVLKAYGYHLAKIKSRHKAQAAYARNAINRKRVEAKAKLKKAFQK